MVKFYCLIRYFILTAYIILSDTASFPTDCLSRFRRWHDVLRGTGYRSSNDSPSPFVMSNLLYRVHRIILRGGHDSFKCSLHDVGESDCTLTWNPVNKARKYEVQMRLDGEDDFKPLSSEITSSMLRKKNLQPSQTYAVRIRSFDGSVWSEFSPIVEFTCLPKESKRMEPPILLSHDADSITIGWSAQPQVRTFEVEMRSDQDGDWSCISSSIQGTALRKKNLLEGVNYYFRVRPSALVTGNLEEAKWAIGLPSAPLRPAATSPFLTKLLGGGETHLVSARGGPSVGLRSLAGKVVGLYCSASWCPPCKQYTPRLAQFYGQMRALGKPFEVIFLSCDRDEGGYNEYLTHMPWLALPFTSPAREAALATLQVQGIPMLTIVGPRGNVAVANAVPMQLSAQLVDTWLRS